MENSLNLQDKNSVDVPSFESMNDKMQQAYKLVDDIVLKNYITKLSELEIVPLDKKILENNLEENVRIFKINEVVYAKDENATHKFASVFNSAQNHDCAVFILIDSDGKKTDFYMGIHSLDSERTSTSLINTIKNSLIGQFPGIKTQDLFDKDMLELIEKIKVKTVASVSCVANDKDDGTVNNENFVQGLEKMAIAMQGQRYTAIVLANGTSSQQLNDVRKAYESIYTQLSPFATMQLSYGTNHALSISNAFSTGTTSGTSHTTNSSKQEGSSFSKGSSSSESESQAKKKSMMAKSMGTALLGVASIVTAPLTGGASLVAAGVIMAGHAGVSSINPKTITKGTSETESYTENKSETHGESDSISETTSETDTETKGLTSGSSNNMQLTMQNKAITNTLERIDIQLERLKECESLGMWECAAYFLGDQESAEMAASTYKALMKGKNSGVEVSAVNYWGVSAEKEVQELKNYITNFIHPVFSYPTSEGAIPVKACSLVSSKELALHMGLPRKSVCGLPVIEHADFGKEVVSYNAKSDNGQTINSHKIKLGKIFNMGSTSNTDVCLDKDSLTMHTFVTGSTGSGKSNTIYEMLSQLKKEYLFNGEAVHFLIIEPAKGEYKEVFGNCEDVTVLGTNPKYSNILKINPFKFPKKVDVLEHIDRLVEIFNVCWPMYAAMPAVLKESIIQAYESSGWDLSTSTNIYSENLFPTFADLQNEIINVIQNSAYSEELKGNYIGSLATRVKSLTNGINGQIFSADEIDNKLLFDTNVIVDLSRIGSQETKSLIMGILIMRLNEHRISFADGMNVPLRHITVLEEAHNILKRTSTEQNPESPSVAGKSVEMLSNAIAEMRTYGEGFIIADQSPNAIDMSAIRNTNTKIVMRLPDEADRRLVGKASALKDEQLDEIAKLPKGVAVVYQNDWVEPVLCKVNMFSGSKSAYSYDPNIETKSVDLVKFKTELIKMLLANRTPEKLDFDIDYIETKLDIVPISTKNKIGIRNLIDEYKINSNLSIWNGRYYGQVSEMVAEVIALAQPITKIVNFNPDFNALNKDLKARISKEIDISEDVLLLEVCQCLLKKYSIDNPENIEIYAAWRETVINNGGII